VVEEEAMTLRLILTLILTLTLITIDVETGVKLNKNKYLIQLIVLCVFVCCFDEEHTPQQEM